MISLMCGSTAGSYFQWRSTEATDVRCEMVVDGSNPSLNKCMKYVLKWWLLTLKTYHRFVLQKWTNLPQCDSYTCSDDWQRDLDIISAASCECPFALRMARKISIRVDLMAGSDVFLSLRRAEWHLGWAVADLRRTAGSDLLAIVPEAPETRKLFLAWELPTSSVLHETGRSSAAHEWPAWMAGTHTGGPSCCPR